MLRDGNDVGTVGNQHRGNRMPEGVSVDVGQAVTVREGPEPMGDTVRVHGLPIVPDEDVAGIVPAVTVFQPKHQAFLAPFPEKLHCLLRQAYRADVAGLCGAFIS